MQPHRRTHQEERGGYALAIERLENARGDRRLRPVVEGEIQHALSPRSATDHATEERARRVVGAPGQAAEGGRTRTDDREKHHLVTRFPPAASTLLVFPGPYRLAPP